MAKKKPAAEVGKKPTSAPDLSYISEALRPLATPIAELKFDPENAKKHAERDLSATAASLRKFGVLKPAVVRRADMQILAGNGSVQAAIEICGWKYYPCVLVDFDRNQSSGFALADNRTSELAEWDTDRVQAMLADIDWDDVELARMGEDFQAELNELCNQAAASAAALTGGSDPNETNPRGSGGSRPQGPPSEKWQIVITCSDEQHQTDLLQRFEAEDIQCRALVS